MLEGNLEKVPEILENKFDIKILYPERKVFHITEVIGFMGVVGLYFGHIGKMEQAELFYKGLKKLAPRHQYTKRLKEHLFIKSVETRFNKLLEKKQSQPL